MHVFVDPDTHPHVVASNGYLVNVSLAVAKRVLETLTNEAERSKLSALIGAAPSENAQVDLSWVSGASADTIRSMVNHGDNFVAAPARAAASPTINATPVADVLTRIQTATHIAESPTTGAVERAHAHLTVAALYMALVSRGINRQDNAMTSLRALLAAVALAPQDRDVANAYLVAMIGTESLNMFIKPFANMGIKNELHKTIDDLAADALLKAKNTPANVETAALVRVLALKIKDAASQAFATGQLRELGATEAQIKAVEDRVAGYSAAAAEAKR